MDRKGKSFVKVTQSSTPGGNVSIAELLKLAFLAPDIIEAINKGDIPETLSLVTLRQGIPLKWQDQRRRFGFA